MQAIATNIFLCQARHVKYENTHKKYEEENAEHGEVESEEVPDEGGDVRQVRLPRTGCGRRSGRLRALHGLQRVNHGKSDE
jgi:hypothetical protein